MKSISFKVKIKNKKNISGTIDLENSNITLIKGEVGSGKTSILRSIYREYVLSKGKKNIAYASLDYPFLLKKTVKENIQSIKEYCKLDEQLLNENLSFLQLTDLLDQKVSLLSEGEKLRFILCLSLANKVEIVLVDEPTSKVDLITANLIKELIIERSKSKKLIIVTHDDIFDDVCQSIYELSDDGFNKIYSMSKELETANKGQEENDVEDNNYNEGNEKKKKNLFHCPTLFHQLKLISNFVFAFLFTFVFLFLSEFTLPLKRNYNPLIKESESLYYDGGTVYDDESGNADYYKSFFPVSKQIYFTIKNDSYVFDVSKSVAEHLTFMPVLEDKNDKFEITSKFYELLKKEFGNFDYHDLILAGNYCEGIISSKDIYISYPFKQKENLLSSYTNTSGTIYRNIGSADVVCDINLNPIDINSITEDQIVVRSYSDFIKIIKNNEGLVSTPKGTKKAVGFIPISSNIRMDKSNYIFSKSLDITEIHWELKGHFITYPTELMKNATQEDAKNHELESLDHKLLYDYMFNLNEYKKQCVVFLISSLVVSNLALIIFVSLDDLLNKDKKNQEFYFSSKRKYCFNNTFSIYDLSIVIPFIIMIAIYFGATKIFTFFNILTLIYFILAYVLLFAVQYFSNYIVHFVKRKFLK